MTKTRSELRDAIRLQVGDSVRISGYATAGTNLTLVDTDNLLQVDGYWNKQKLYILDTFDANNIPPMGEERKIANFDSATNTITIENAFTDSVDAGDQYQICVWPDTLYNQIITDAIKAYSKYRNYKTTGTFSSSVGVRRYSPPSGLDLAAGHIIDEIRYVNDSTQEDYPIYGWSTDRHQNKIDIGYFYQEAKTFTVFYSKSHDDFSSDSDTITVPDDDERFLIKWCYAQFLRFMSKEAFDDFGNLAPASWTRGQISENIGQTRNNMYLLYKQEMDEWEKEITQAAFLIEKDINANINQEWIPPRDFRETY